MEVLDFSAPHQAIPKGPLLKNLKLAAGPGKLRASGVMDLAGERGNLEVTAQPAAVGPTPRPLDYCFR